MVPGTEWPAHTKAMLAMVETSADRLARDVAGLDDVAITAPSRLPGWSRGHVLAHVARNADALRNLLVWARTGVETPMYPSREVRDRDIETGAARPAEEHRADLAAAHDRFMAAAEELTDVHWGTTVRWGYDGRPGTADLVPWLRLVEVEIHHVDLDVGYTPAHWPAEFADRQLGRTVEDWRLRTDAPSALLHASDTGAQHVLGDPDDPGRVRVSGPSTALLAWLVGRSDAAGLTVEPEDAGLPRLPPWR